MGQSFESELSQQAARSIQSRQKNRKLEMQQGRKSGPAAAVCVSVQAGVVIKKLKSRAKMMKMTMKEATPAASAEAHVHRRRCSVC